MSDSPEEIAGVADVDCRDKTALVTGSTSGIGRAAALALGRLGAEGVVHGQDVASGESVVEALSRTGVEATFCEADFRSVDAVEALAETVRTRRGWTAGQPGGASRSLRLTKAGRMTAATHPP